MRVLKQVWPHITILGLFAGFIAWNGSVVLGDKSNHVATVHLAQMLYLWPFFAFFSVPLILTSLINLPTKVWCSLLGPQTLQSPSREGGRAKTADIPSKEPAKSLLLRIVESLFVNKFYYLPYLFATLLISLAVVHFNTVIHPFTLADNRHYMFYVFRYTIRRPGLTKYYLVIAYTISRWLVWDRLAGCSPYFSSDAGRDCPAEQQKAVQYINTPFLTERMKRLKAPADRKRREQQQQLESAADSTGAVTIGLLDEPGCSSTSSPSTSTVLLWLLTTALSLVTAPLVEPRYFILPWVFWRLLVPAWNYHSCRESPEWLARLRDHPILGRVMTLAKKVDLTLVVETAWFLAINAGTMYVFISKPYHWFDEDGKPLDMGRLQRFMW